jgi:TrpR-related protein YerC/YecD
MKHRFTEDSWRKEPWFRSLCAAIKSCKTEVELANFLRDVGALSELQAWGERLEVARLLSRGLSYRQVSAGTGASTTTVTRVASFLENGEGGYRKVLNTHRHHRMHVGPLQVHATDPETRAKDAESDAPRKMSSLQKYLGK